MSLFFILIGHRDFFGFGCSIFAPADCIFSPVFFILFSRTIPILPKGTSYQSLSKVQLRRHSLFTTNFFFFTCTVVTMLLRVLSSRVCACSDIWCHRNTSVKHKAWARKVHFSVSRALISRAKGKHKEKRLSRKICTKNQTSIRSCQSVKGNKSREKENLKICFHKACLSTGFLLMYHYVLSFIKKVLRFSNIATYRLVWLFLRELSYEKSAEIRKETWCAHFARNSGSDTLLCASLPEYMHRLITFLCRFFCLERWKKREM